MSDLPEPLTPDDCDLTDFGFMPLDVRRLRDSRLAAASSGDGFRAAVLLWCAAWHQVPAGSLPNDDVELAQLAGYGRVVREWMAVRDDALHGFILCSDGRLYHPVVCEKAIEAWNEKRDHGWQRECDRIRKENKRRTEAGQPALEIPERPRRISGGRNAGANGKPPPSGGSGGRSAGIPSENALKGQGQGQGNGKEEVAKAAKPESGPPAGAREPTPLMPRLSDPHQRWAHLGDRDEIDPDTGKRHVLVAGFYLDVICRLVCEAAGINDANFRGDWRPVIAWLKDGIDPHEQIIPAIQRAASRSNYRPSEIRSLAYFDAAVRDARRVA